MDLHTEQIQGFFDIPVDHLYAAPVMYEYLKQKQLTDLVVVSPDVGGLKMAHAYSQVMESGLAIADRLRTGIVHINDQTVNDNAYVPFGGRGASGNGTRFGALHSQDEFTQWQWLTVRTEPARYPQ